MHGPGPGWLASHPLTCQLQRSNMHMHACSGAAVGCGWLMEWAVLRASQSERTAQQMCSGATLCGCGACMQGWRARLQRMAGLGPQHAAPSSDPRVMLYLHEILLAAQMEPLRTTHYLHAGEGLGQGQGQGVGSSPLSQCVRGGGIGLWSTRRGPTQEVALTFLVRRVCWCRTCGCVHPMQRSCGQQRLRTEGVLALPLPHGHA